MSDLQRVEAFISELAKHERKLALHTLTLVPHPADAEDILQQAKLVMWRSFDRFELGTNFGAWARKVILHQVLNYRKKKKKDRLWFDDDVLELVADETEQLNESLELQQAALKDCVAKLPEDHRQILHARYFANRSIEDISAEVDRTEGAVYRLLSRIRKLLHDCISKTTRQNHPNHA